MKSMLWARRAVYLCALAGALFGQIFDVGWIFHYIFIFTLLLPVLSLLLSLPGILGLRLYLAADRREVHRNASVCWAMSAGSRSGLPVSCVTGRVALRYSFTGERVSFPVSLRGASPGRSVTWTVNTEHCGMVECSVSRLRVWDWEIERDPDLRARR